MNLGLIIKSDFINKNVEGMSIIEKRRAQEKILPKPKEPFIKNINIELIISEMNNDNEIKIK